MVRKDKMVLTSDEAIHYFISTHLSYQPRDGLAMWRQRAFMPRKKGNDACSPHTAIRPTSTLTNPK